MEKFNVNEMENRQKFPRPLELEVPAGEDPLQFLAELFGAPTPIDEMPAISDSDEVYEVALK